MGDELRIELSDEARKIVRDLGQSDWLLQAIAKTSNEQNELNVGHIRKEYASFPKHGPSVPIGLRVQSGQYRRALNRADAVIEGSQVISGIGDSVKYAAVHEFGFSGEVKVRPHARKKFRVMDFDAGYTKLGKRMRVRKRVRQADVFVGVGKRKVNLPARAPIQRGIRDRLDEMGAAISSAVVQAFYQNGTK